MMTENRTGQKAVTSWPVRWLVQSPKPRALSPELRPVRPYASCFTLSAAWAAASLATGTRNGEQLT